MHGNASRKVNPTHMNPVKNSSFIPDMFSLTDAVNMGNKVPTVNVDSALEGSNVGCKEPVNRGLGGRRLKAIKIPKKKAPNSNIELPFARGEAAGTAGNRMIVIAD